MNEQKITELLGLLELSDKDFENAMEEHGYLSVTGEYENLETLAFQLRDKVEHGGFLEAIHRVQKYESKDQKNVFDFATWAITKAQPKEWIVAALIAKQLSV